MADGGTPRAATRREVLLVDGMFCAACAASVEAALAKTPGVARASVNFAADAAVVEWSGEAGDSDALVARIGELGYRARRPGEPEAGEGGRSASRDLTLRLVVAVFFGMWTMLPSIALYLGVASETAARWLAIGAGAASLPVVAWSGLPFYRMGLATLRNGVAGVDALVMLGVLGSLVLSAGNLALGTSEVYFEVAVALITLQLVARVFDLRTRGRARDAVGGMLELAPSTIRVRGDDGAWREVAAADAAKGMLARVSPGQRLPVDGTVRSGTAHIDRSLTSGESGPVRVGEGASLLAGELVLDGSLDIEITARPGGRRIDALAKLVRQSLARKPAWQRRVDAVARHFLLIACALALAGLSIAAAQGAPLVDATSRALAVFVIACPCALSLAAPIAGFFATVAAAKRGIVLRDLNAITGAAAPDRWFLDKTGTLTLGRPAVTAVHPGQGLDRDDVLACAGAAEARSEHPIGRAIAAAAGVADEAPAHVQAVPGHGVIATCDGARVHVGRLDWLASEGVGVPALPPTTATRVGVARDARWIGAIDLADPLRDAAGPALRESGMRAPEILSGDRPAAVEVVAGALGIAGRGGLTPEDKVEAIERAQAAGETVAFVGDGLNDGPAIAAADLGVAVGSATDATRAAAAATLVGRGIEAVPELLEITTRARRVIRQNLGWAIVYNAVAVPAALAGYVHPAVAAVAMALSSVTVVANAARLLRA